jgi:hypothetical protein
MLFLMLIAFIQISGCATTPTVPNSQFTVSQHWHRNLDGNYVHTNGRVISEERYGQLVADEVNSRLNSAAEKIPKKCKRKVQY